MFHPFPADLIMQMLHSPNIRRILGDWATCHWSIGELTAATSGADGKRRRVFKKVRLSGLREVLAWVIVGETCSLDEGSLERASRLFHAGR